MKDENGIEIKCENCELYNGKFCEIRETYPECNKGGYFNPTIDAYKARIAELQKELTVIQESERAEAQEADKLRAEVRWLKKENERLSKEIIDLGTGTLAEKNYQSTIKQIQNPSESFYQKYSGVSEEYALGALEQCATEADELQARVKDLEKKLTETIKLLSERSRECGELEAYNEVLQRRIREFSMELLDRTMKENKDVLERLKQAESEDNYENYDIERDYD